MRALILEARIERLRREPSSNDGARRFCALIAIVLRCLIASAPHLLFATGAGDWVQLDEQGSVIRRFDRIGNIAVLDAAISPDGRRWAIATMLPNGRRALALLEDFDGAPRIIEGVGSVLDHLAFSQDGEWVYFSANDSKAPPIDGQSMQYAQVYRTQFSRGSELQRLSNSRGCHLWPRSAGRRNVFFAHANCGTSGRSLALLDTTTGREQDLVSFEHQVGELSWHPSGRIAYSIPTNQGVELRILNIKTRVGKTWALFRSDLPVERPQWAQAGDTIYLRLGHQILSVDADGNTKIIRDLSK
ncbi:MAG: hypothetical protein Q8N23_01470 [Archangium sp.]|nr:hypothetical protein [Archangium sp.]MDP3571636.1 hypothetical protein [Archangium sp.]